MLVIVLAVISMFEVSDDVEVDADVADSGGTLFSLKPIIGFLFAFGWAGGASLSSGLSILVALGCGLAVMLALAWVLRTPLRSAQPSADVVSPAG